MKLSRLAALWQLPFQSVLTTPASSSSSVSILSNAPASAAVVPPDMVSFSIEYRHLPKFTGTLDEPNEFSKNLLDNLKACTGEYPLIRVGGGSQDFAYYNSSQQAAEVDIPGVPKGQKGNGPTASISARYFDSFKVWSHINFIVGVNLGFYNGAGVSSLEKMVKYTCKALGDRLVMWEVGNEPDLFPNWNQRTRSTWKIPVYVSEWKNYASKVIDQAKESCGKSYNKPFYGPSIATASNNPDGFTDVAAFAAGINSNSKTPIAGIATHSYMGIGGSSSLQGTVMNHAKVKTAIAKYLKLQGDLAKYNIPFSIGEGNSLTGGGQAGVSDVFGAALWAADYSLYVATLAHKIVRTHYHQSYNAEKGSPYNAWKPISDGLGSPSTNPPYYGHLLAARAIGADSQCKIVEVTLPSTDGLESMYVSYNSNGPQRITVLNMKEWDGTSTRHTRTYSVKLPSGSLWGFQVERLQASSAKAKSGVTFGGNSYDYNSRGLARAASASVRKASAGGVTIYGNTLSIKVPDSEAVLVTLHKRSYGPKDKRDFHTYGLDKYKCLPVHASTDEIPFGWIDCSKS